MSDAETSSIYRQAWYGNRPKSVALRRESDYHTGLSFSTKQPGDVPFFVYHVSLLIEAEYSVTFNGSQVIVSKWDPGWILKDKQGRARIYGKDHVSVISDQDTWSRWYQAELAVGGDGSTSFSRSFFELAAAYQEG